VEMRRYHGRDFGYVQFWADSDHPDRFWIRPAAREDGGSARIVLNPKNGTRTVSAAFLLKSLDWKAKGSVRYPLRWDSENDAAVVITETR